MAADTAFSTPRGIFTALASTSEGWTFLSAHAHLAHMGIFPCTGCVLCWTFSFHPGSFFSLFQAQLSHCLLLKPWSPRPLACTPVCCDTGSPYQGFLPTQHKCPFLLHFPGVGRLTSCEDEDSSHMAGGGLWQALVAGALVHLPVASSVS